MKLNYLRKNVILLTLFQICSNGFSITIPVIVLFWKSHGLSLTTIMLLQSYFAILIVLLEVPSGYLADVWGRKPVLRLSALFLAAASGVYFLADSYVHFMIAETFFALGISFFSGTDAALLYDSLLEHGKSEKFDRIWGSICTASLISSGVFTLLSGILFTFNSKLPFLLSTVVTSCMFPAAIALIEPKREKMDSNCNYVAEFIRILKDAIIKNRNYRFMVMNFMFIQTITHIGFWFYQPYFITLKIDPFWFGFIFTLYSACAAFASKFSYKLPKTVNRTRRTFLQSLLLASGFIVMAYCRSGYGFLTGVIPQMIYGWFLVSRATEVNGTVDSKERATLLSFCSMSGNLVYALVLPGFGLIADNFSLNHAFIFCAIISGCGAMAMMILMLLKKSIFQRGREEDRTGRNINLKPV